MCLGNEDATVTAPGRNGVWSGHMLFMVEFENYCVSLSHTRVLKFLCVRGGVRNRYYRISVCERGPYIGKVVCESRALGVCEVILRVSRPHTRIHTLMHTQTHTYTHTYTHTQHTHNKTQTRTHNTHTHSYNPDNRHTRRLSV